MAGTGFWTLGGLTTRKRKMTNPHIIALSMTCTGAVQEGQFVKVTTNVGECALVAARTDAVLGQVSSGSAATDGTAFVSVETGFQSVNFGFADGPIATRGAKLATSGNDPDNVGFSLMKVAVSGDTVVGIALTTATDGNSIMFGAVMQPFTLP